MIRLLIGFLVAAALPAAGQTPQLSKEYIRLGGRVIAVENAATPDLTIAKSHTGNFTQGQTGATYTITVSNVGAGQTNGTVTVTDTLPTGLTVTDMSGLGWSCPAGTLTCTRSDALPAIASYPAITLTVNVASEAPFGVTNVAAVSGGGETNTTNDAASDVTWINCASGRIPTAAMRNANGGVSVTLYALSALFDGGGVFGDEPGAAQNGAGDTVVVARDIPGSLWARVFDAGTQAWVGSWSFGGGLTQGTPATAVATNGTAYIAARDNSNSYWITSYVPPSSFGAWTNLAGIFSTDPVMAAAPDGSVYIVGKDTSNSLWSGRYIPGSGFQGWQFGAGIVKGKPSVTVGTDNVAYIAARDNWDSLWMARVQGNTWLGWSYGGGVMSADPQVAAAGNGTIFAVLLDPWNVVAYRGYTEGTSGGWLSWIYPGGILRDLTTAAAAGELYIAGRDLNNDLWWYREAGNLWTNIGNRGAAAGPLVAAPR